MAENKKKSFYSCLDITCARVASQGVQHLVIGQFAEQLGGMVTFYTTENSLTGQTHEVILGKVDEKPAVDGIIFYRLAQFVSPEGKPAMAAMRRILDAGYALHFAMDKVSLRTKEELEAFFPMFYATAHTEARDRARDFLAGFIPDSR